MFDIIVK